MDSDFTNENGGDSRENASTISSDLIRGHINTIILRTLYDGDKYGYEIINEIEEKSKKQYTLKQPTLYSALKRLESQDYVTSYWGGASNGGRRKYFQITDKGRQVVEQNLAEWEYSRTVIDSLISEKDYDFSNPPPAQSVDFSILKKSTTRVTIPGGESTDSDDDYFAEPTDQSPTLPLQDERDDAPAAAASDEAATAAETGADAAKYEDSAAAQEEPAAPQEAAAPAGDAMAYGEPEEDDGFYAELPPYEEPASAAEAPAQDAAFGETQPQAAPSADRTAAYAAPSAPPESEESGLTEDDKRRIHENYKILIGDEDDATSYYYSSVARTNAEAAQAAPEPEPPYEEPAPAPDYPYPPEDYGAPQEQPGDLLYANRSPAERNYKELISKLYENAQPAPADAAPEQPTPPSVHADFAAPEEQPGLAPAQQPVNARPASNIEFYDVEEKAESEGLKITTNNGARSRTAARAIGNTFDKGKVLFVTAVYVFVVALAESIINICLMGVLDSGAAYVVLPFVFSFAMLGVFLFLYLRGYGKNSRKSQAKSYVSASLILYANLVLIICLIAYLVIYFGEQPFHFVQILRYAIFPCIFVFNIPLFAILYNYNCKKE